MTKRGYVAMTADLFHYGHVNFLRQAKSQCNYLIVGIHNDEAVASYKRIPVMNMNERAAVVESCKYVDEMKLLTGSRNDTKSVSLKTFYR